VNSLTLKLNP